MSTKQSNITLTSKCVNVPYNVRIYDTEQQRVKDQVPVSTVTHNAVCNTVVSRRNKVRFEQDNMLDRKNKVRERLLKKLAAKAAKKKSKSS
jgi:hypothetical protein